LLQNKIGIGLLHKSFLWNVASVFVYNVTNKMSLRDREWDY